MTARTHQQAMCMEAAEIDAAAWGAFFDDQARYATDPFYRAQQDADRAARQAIVSDRMTAGIARHRGPHPWIDGEVL